jgi:SAM-dependent methyltransferase
MSKSLDLSAIAAGTLAHYEQSARSFWQGTRDHDVSQNRAALLDAIEGPAPHVILDLGCGPGRDLRHFADLGHRAVGLEGCLPFVEMARAHSGCEVLHQDLLDPHLPEGTFDGIFANASLFHVPGERLPHVLSALWRALKPRGVLFSSNPRGENQEGWSGDRYGRYHDLEGWRGFLLTAGFGELSHYYRPPGLPRDRQPWLASVWRKIG